MRGYLLIPPLLLAAFDAQAASFDCARASAPVEKAICSDPGISELDTRLGGAYRNARQALGTDEALKALKANQKAWLVKRNSRCEPGFTPECLSALYEQRIAVLELLPSPDFSQLPAGHVAGEYARGESMSLHVDALSARRISVDIEGAELTMARWICEFSGIGEIDDEGLAKIIDPDTGNSIPIIFVDCGATVETPETSLGSYCGLGGTLNGRYRRTGFAPVASPPPQSTDAGFEPDSEEAPDYQTPLSQLQSRAERGDAAAQNDLAVRYAFGDGVAQNMERALAWFHKAADQWNTEAMYNLGFTFFYGKGVTIDPDKGLTWLHKAAEAGFGQASLEIARIHEEGRGVPQDTEKAGVWLRRAAYQDDPWAQYRLGRRYYEGEDVPRNFAEAVRWFTRATEQDEAESQYALALMHFRGEGLPQDPVLASMWLDLATSRTETAEDTANLLESLPRALSPAEMTRGKTMAEEWRTTHHPGGSDARMPDREAPEDPWGQYIEGTRHYHGNGVARDPSVAARWFHKAAEQEDSRSQYYLAIMYATGEGVPVDYVHAYLWLLLATDNAGATADDEGLLDKLPGLMTPDQITKAKSLATEWWGD